MDCCQVALVLNSLVAHRGPADFASYTWRATARDPFNDVENHKFDLNVSKQNLPIQFLIGTVSTIVIRLIQHKPTQLRSNNVDVHFPCSLDGANTRANWWIYFVFDKLICFAHVFHIPCNYYF